MYRHQDSLSLDHVTLEPYRYEEDFESGTLRAWASYPPWQDTAYDPDFRNGWIVTGDPNRSIVQKVTPFHHGEAWAGAQKEFDAFLVPGSFLSFRYYLKSHLPAECIAVRLAAGPGRMIERRIPGPTLNRWTPAVLRFEDFIEQTPEFAGSSRIRVNALAVLAVLPAADPDMPFYFGLDDVVFEGARMAAFRFSEPQVYTLDEWRPRIPKRHYHSGNLLRVRGDWPFEADRTEAVIAPFSGGAPVYTGELVRNRNSWELEPLEIEWPQGLYRGMLRAYRGGRIAAWTEFTVHIAPQNMEGAHPRLWFDRESRADVEARLRSDRFRHILDRLPVEAAEHRKTVPAEGLVFDLDQFPDENWLPTWEAWGSRLYSTAEPLYVNALSHVFAGDREAGEYLRDVLLRLARFEHWTHPWQMKRGRFTEHRSGWWAHRLALAYDLGYELWNEEERALIRGVFRDRIVEATHRMYVEDNDVIGQTSNWISHTCGGSLMLQAAMFGDSPEVESLEPYFTGAILKLAAFLERVTDPDGAWGEGLGYNIYSFHTLCQSLPALERVFGVDLSGPLDGSWREMVWAGPVKQRRCFYFGDTEGNLNPITNWAWLLPKFRDPLLGWLYQYLRGGSLESNTQASMTGYMDLINRKDETFMDVLFETGEVPRRDPFDENPVRCFRKVGTTVFKSGWETEDFIFVLRTGAFFNHQHLDQGTFWLADRGEVFIGERRGSSYYDDPLYQPRYIQPVAHSTILIDRHPQSQRAGDHADFAPGFEDHALVADFLEGECAAFVSGDIGRLYRGAVRSITRNVLYLKPRTVLMLDVVTPGDRDREVTQLYQAGLLEGIRAGEAKTGGVSVSTITREISTLHIAHLHPETVAVEAVKTPHYLYTLRRERPLRREGMLAATARTTGGPLVMASLLTTTTGGEPLDLNVCRGDACVTGSVNGTPFAFSTAPGGMYRTGDFETDALALTWTGGRVFAALCTVLKHQGHVAMMADKPVVREVSV